MFIKYRYQCFKPDSDPAISYEPFKIFNFSISAFNGATVGCLDPDLDSLSGSGSKDPFKPDPIRIRIQNNDWAQSTDQSRITQQNSLQLYIA